MLQTRFKAAGLRFVKPHRFKPMSNFSALPAIAAERANAALAIGAPSWRAMGVLVLVVLAAHALVLRSAPSQFGPAPELSPRHTRAFVTRSIAPPQRPEAAVPVTAARVMPIAKPADKPAPQKNLKKKVASAQVEYAQPAIDLIAKADPEPVPAIDPDAPISPGSAPAAITDMLDPDPVTAAPAMAAASAAAVSAASAAIAAEVPPVGPSLSPPTAMALPASIRLEYNMTGRAKGLTYYASAELLWNNAGSSYDASLTVSAFLLGSRSMSSSGRLSAEGLAPTRFSDKSRTEVAAHFEPDKGQISFSANTPPVPWVKGAQDRMSVFLQLGGMLAGNPAGFPAGASIVLYTVGPRDADTWTFVVQAGEKLDLPYGEVSTLKLSRQPRREFDQTIELWYAPALGYLPVRSRITQHNGDFVDQQLSALTPP